MDGDGKPDIIVANRTTNKISILLNSASSGAFSAGSLSKTEIDPGVSLRHVTIGDVNMDGEPDIIFSLASDDYVRVMINTSTAGNLSFSTSSDFYAGDDNDEITSISVHDIDSDGKPDIIATLDVTSGNLRILRNTTIPGSSMVSFTSGSNASYNLSGTRARRIAIGDLDGDGKPEIVAAFYTLNYTEGGGSKVTVLKNESYPGLIKFNSTQTPYATGTGPYDVALGDLDGDGKLDIVTSNLADGAGSTVSILRNTGTGFAAFESFPTGNQPKGIAIADMNGDGKPEIITSNINPTASSISVLNNASTSGSLAFSTNLNFTSGILPNILLVNDLDSDGRPEIITGNYMDNTISVFKNTLEIPAPVISSFTPVSAKKGTTISITGTRFSGATSVKFGGVEATSYTVVSAASITAVVGDGSSGDITITTPSGTGTLAGFSYLASDASLASISLSSGTLSPVFASGVTSYSASVNNLVDSITVTPMSGEANASVTVNGAAVVSGSASDKIALAVGNNTITTVVTAQDGNTVKTYIITVTRAVSSDATLASINLSSGTLKPEFASGTLTYSVNVGHEISSIAITPTLNASNATLKINETALVSGNTSGNIPLKVGTNDIILLVTAADGSTAKTYTLSVNRAASSDATLTSIGLSNGTLSPVFASGAIAYTASVNNSVSSITVTPTLTNAGATIKVNGTVVASGNASANIPLTVGSNEINVLVTAQDGSTSKSYTIAINREAAGSINVTLNNNNNNIQITSPTAPVNVTIAAGTSRPVINYNALLTAGVARVPQTNINSTLAKITIPAATNITGTPSPWNGELSGPTTASYNLPQIPGEITTMGVGIEIGNPNGSLTFDRGVRLLLYGQAGKRIAWIHQDVYTEILTVGSADSQVDADLLPSNGAFKIDVGPDLVVWTKGFSRFITFSQSVDPNVAVVAADRDALNGDAILGSNADLQHITNSLINPLPSIGSGGSQITWQSDNPSVLSSDGRLILRPALGSTNSIVNLTATISKGTVTHTKSFALSILPAVNQAPTLSAIPKQIICYTNKTQYVILSGLSAGTETDQSITLSVSSDNPALFSQLGVDQITGQISYIPATTMGGTATVTVTVKDNGGTINGGIDNFSRTFTIQINPLPTISLSSSLGNEISKGQLIVLDAALGFAYSWSDDNGLIANQSGSSLTVRPTRNTTYTVTATNGAGCITTASILIKVLEDYMALEINNLVSPNGDGYNDALVIQNLDMYPNHTLRIFDRSGRILYQKKGLPERLDRDFSGYTTHRRNLLLRP